MSNPSSLRDLYSTNPPTWSFTPPNSTGPPPGPPQSQQMSSVSSHTFSSRPMQNSIFELSPELAEPGGLDLGLLLKTLIASAVLGYTTTAIAMPWEVGKCLLQVQWVPRDAEQLDDAEPATVEVAEEVCPVFCVLLGPEPTHDCSRVTTILGKNRTLQTHSIRDRRVIRFHVQPTSADMSYVRTSWKRARGRTMSFQWGARMEYGT